MRDPLFERKNDYLAHARALQEAVHTQIGELEDPDQAVRTLAAWCRDALREYGLASPTPTIPLVDFLSRYGATASPAPIKEGLAALIANTDHPQRHLTAWLLGQALANLLVDELTVGNTPLLLLPPDLDGAPSPFDLTHAAFHRSLRQKLPDASAARAMLLSLLKKQIELIDENPGFGTYTNDRDRFLAFLSDWKSKRTLDALWRSPGDTFFVFYQALDLVPTILSVERKAVLVLMDRIRFPHPINQVLMSNSVLHDREAISAALEAAPVCSEDGQAWNGSHLAPLLLRTAEVHARELWQAAEGSDDSDTARDEIKALLPAWFEKIARVVLGRPDGEFLASQWTLAKMVDERRSRHSTPSEDEGEHADRFLPQITLIEWIFTGLSAAGLTQDSIAATVDFPAIPTRLQVSPTRSSPRADEAVNPCLRALCAIDLVESARGTPKADHTVFLLDRLDALLLHRDAVFEIEFSLATNTHDLPASRCGSLLASSSDPAGRWRRSWDALVEQRRRTQHWLQTDDADALAPSMFLLAIGIAAIDWMLSIPDRRDVKMDELWRLLFDAARECWLTNSLTHLVQRVEVQIQRLFARHPRVFGNPPAETGGDSQQHKATEDDYATLLAKDLALLGGDDAMVAHCYVNAHLNGVRAETLDAVRRHDSSRIDSSLRQFVRWQALERPNRRLPHLLAQLSELQSEQDTS